MRYMVVAFLVAWGITFYSELIGYTAGTISGAVMLFGISVMIYTSHAD